MRTTKRLLMMMVPLLLASCGDSSMRDTLGLNRDAPDEYTVLSRPPLSVPPEFTLRPPRPGAAPLTPSATDLAREAVTGTPATVRLDPADLTEPTVPTAVTPVIATETPSGAASILLQKAGASKANENIRTQLGTDAATPLDTSKATSLYEKLAGDDKIEPTVDAKKEAERLRTNKDTGKPVTAGAVPEETNQPKSVLDRVF